jgi:hypothetical protein
MPAAALCAICHKRKAKRNCPGLRQDICALCCGTEREVTVDCPFDCTYLRESRRYGWEKFPPPASLPFPEMEVGESFLAEHEQFIGQIGLALLRYTLENPKTTDHDLEGALEKMVRTYETLSSGIYYESLPEESSQIGVFRTLKSFLDEYQEKERKQAGGLAGLKSSDVIRSLVFLDRLATVHSNKRPRGKAFIDFLRQTYPEVAAARKEESGLIIPGI